MYYKILFIIGLLFLMIGQILLALGNEFVYTLKPIDFAHWSIFLGVALMISQSVSFPKSIFSYLGFPLVLIGIVCIIGMCVLDFIWWSFPTQEMRHQFTNHVSKVPSIWKPFITIGPSTYIFNSGLLILSFNYFKQNKLGVYIIILASLIIFFGRFIPFRLIYGYLLTAIGFGTLFFMKTEINENQT